MVDIEVLAAPVERGEQVLTGEALDFLADLHDAFARRRDELLAARHARRAELAHGRRLDFLPATKAIREGAWTVAAAPADLVDRRVEMTGPTERKMSINALNSGARVWLADFEDANTPHWSNVVGGQVNLIDAVRRTISYRSPEGRLYELRDDLRLATIMVRPRGWHLDERHIRVHGRPTVGALVDFGLYFFHNAAELITRGTGPYFYLPKMESHLEARLWNDVFGFAEQRLGIEAGTVRATVLIETIPAAFEMDEILYELRRYSAGLNAGRWDYLFSVIKNFRDAGADFLLPDRNSVTMTAPFMRAYTELLVQTCHKRGAFAIGGMAAFIPSRTNPEINQHALAKVREDKQREAADGFDGSWVAHPDLVPVCQEVFDEHLDTHPNQLHRQRPEVRVGTDALLDVHSTPGAVTEAGLRNNIEVALRYLAAWLAGNGAVGIHNLMEDTATAEIARSQIWQWVHNEAKLDDGRTVTPELVRGILEEEFSGIRGQTEPTAQLQQARELFAEVALADDFIEFLTLPAYQLID